MGSLADQILGTFVPATALSEGQVVRVTGNKQVGVADASDPDLVVGVLGVVASGAVGAGGSVQVVTSGKATVRFKTGLTLAGGDTIYVSDDVPGSATNVATAANVTVIGVVTDASQYAGGNPFAEGQISLGAGASNGGDTFPTYFWAADDMRSAVGSDLPGNVPALLAPDVTNTAVPARKFSGVDTEDNAVVLPIFQLPTGTTSFELSFLYKQDGADAAANATLNLQLRKYENAAAASAFCTAIPLSLAVAGNATEYRTGTFPIAYADLAPLTVAAGDYVQIFLQRTPADAFDGTLNLIQAEVTFVA